MSDLTLPGWSSPLSQLILTFMSSTKETTDGKPKVKHVLDALLEAGLPPRALWQRFLQLGCETFASEAGVLWVVSSDSEELHPQGMCGNIDLRQAVVQRDTRQISHVLQAAATDETVIHHADAADEDPWTGRALMALPVHTQGELYGVLEFIQTADQKDDFLEEQKRLLETDLKYVEQCSVESDTRSPDDDDQSWREFEELSYNIHRSLRMSDVADVAVNDGRQFLGCDRLSISVLRGRKNTVLAVAGQDLVNRRSEEVRSLQRIAAEAVSVGEMIEYRADQAESAPRLREQLSRHVELSASKFILAVPLYAAATRPADKISEPQSESVRRIVGCLLIEQFRRNQLEPDRAQRVPVLADTVGSALANALSQQQILFHPTRRRLGTALDYFRGRRLAKTLLFLSVVLTVVLALVFVPFEYRVEAEGRLMPETQCHLFAPWDGVVVAVRVSNGERVARGDEILRIYNDELHAELVASENELNEKQQQMLSIRKEITSTARVPTDRRTEIQLKGQQEEIRLEIAGLRKQIAILKQREDALRLTAPIDGVVATFQLQEKLRDRPVIRGEHLLEIMDDRADWVLELQMPEHRMGHLLRAVEANDGKPLEVEYALATDAQGSFSGYLNPENIASRSELEKDSGVVVHMRVQTDKQKLPFRRIGGEATAKVGCGRMSLGYVLLGDAWEFILRHIWV